MGEKKKENEPLEEKAARIRRKLEARADQLGALLGQSQRDAAVRAKEKVTELLDSIDEFLGDE